jgi:hypothetical protein
MMIDNQVEPLVRAVLEGAVKRDAPGFDAALRAFPSEPATRQGLELALSIIIVVLAQLYPDGPSPEDLDALAAFVAEEEAWVGPSPAEVATFLKTLLSGKALDEALPPVSDAVLSYVVAANLLASVSKPAEGEWWFDYLDKVEAFLETR